MNDLRLLQARWQLELLAPEEVPALATDLLANRHDGPAIRQLAGLLAPTNREVALLVGRACREAALDPLSDDEAQWLIVYDAARRIASGEAEPHAGAGEIAARCIALDYPEPLRGFVYLWSDYDEDPHDTAWFDREIRESAAELLRSRGGAA